MKDEKKHLYLDRVGFLRAGLREALFADLTLHFGGAEFCCILGPSGCGKTTLLHLLAGLLTPTSGAVYHDGSRVVSPAPSRGIVFQDLALFEWLTALANVEFPLRIAKVPPVERTQRALALLDQVGLSDYRNFLPKQLSGGMRQRLALARTLALEPSILLLDEPFGSVDALTRRGLHRLLLDLWRNHHPTVIMVTHDIDEAIRCAQRVIVLSGRPANVTIDISIAGTHPESGEIADLAEVTRLHQRLLGALESSASPASL